MACRTQAEIAAEHLTDEAVIQRPTRTADGAGGTVPTFSDVATVSARLAPYGEGYMEQRLADRLAGRSAYRLRVPNGTDLRMGDAVVVEGRFLEVVSLSTAPTATLWTAIVGEVS